MQCHHFDEEQPVLCTSRRCRAPHFAGISPAPELMRFLSASNTESTDYGSAPRSVACPASARILVDALATHSAICVRTSALGCILTTQIDKYQLRMGFFLSGTRGGPQPQAFRDQITRSSESDGDVQKATSIEVHDWMLVRLHRLSRCGEAGQWMQGARMKRGLQHCL